MNVHAGLHRRTQDFTTKGFTWWRARGPRAPEAGAICEISVQFLMFSGIKFWI